jgi:hypothetical protein
MVLNIINRRVAVALSMDDEIEHTRREAVSNASTIAKGDREQLPAMKIQIFSFR